MDKNLANYIFHNETLYQNSDNVTVVNEELSIGAVTNPSEKENYQVTEKVVIPVKETTQITPLSAIKPIEKEFFKEETDFYQMSTNHLVVVNNINAVEREFLVKVLMALNMSLAKVDLLDISKFLNTNFKEIIYNNTVKSILYLGEETGGEFVPKLKLAPYQVRDIKQIKFMVADNLNEINLNQNNEKRMLWEGLKGLYN